MQSLNEKLRTKAEFIPRPYYEFCCTSMHLMNNGEDLNVLENFIDDLTDFNKSKVQAVENFCSSCGDQEIVARLRNLLIDVLNYNNHLVDEKEDGFEPEGELVNELNRLSTQSSFVNALNRLINIYSRIVEENYEGMPELVPVPVEENIDYEGMPELVPVPVEENIDYEGMPELVPVPVEENIDYEDMPELVPVPVEEENYEDMPD
jgi:hypothetical protein